MNKKIRVLRILEYEYDSIEIMEVDQARWTPGLNGTFTLPSVVTIRSATLPFEVVEKMMEEEDG